MQNYKNIFFRIQKYLQYQLCAKHRKGYGIHSPFLWQLIRLVLNTRGNFHAYYTVRKVKRQLNKNKQIISITDMGAGGKYKARKTVKLNKLAAQSSLSQKYGELLFRLVNYFQPEIILELGTSLGISSLYMALARKEAKLFTIEACSERLKVAKKMHAQAGLKNITHINRNFDDALFELLKELPKLDFVFFDGNHQKDATLAYFEACKSKAHKDSIFIFDDIHWSKSMHDAWKIIKKDKAVSLTVNLFQIGIVFFKKELSKQNFDIRY
jgi:predicted O-methyltransferase YrrM